jgi:phosphatidylserine decarboxylase
LIRLLITASLISAALEADATGSITIHSAWIAEAAPGATANAGYVEMQNTGTIPITLLSVASPLFTRIEVHRTITENDFTRMEHHPALVLDPGERLVLRPGDFHLMLYNAASRLESGDKATLIFEFSDGSSIEVQAEVRHIADPVLLNQVYKTESTTATTMFDGVKSSIQYLLPQHMLSGLAYKLTRITWQPWKNFLITSFIRAYNVDMSIALQPGPSAYKHFNDFFTRGLKPSARPVDTGAAAVVSPVDGTVSQAGRISQGRLIQAKGRDYGLEALLAGDEALARTFREGDYITLYLSPRDYHRVHMPVTGTLKSMSYVPGDLFSVSPATTEGIDNLFARNERIIQVFDTEIGSMALIMVGAVFVGSMETVWAGEVTPAAERKPSIVRYANNASPVALSKGEEMGRFNMGSTVILLFENNRIRLDATVQAGTPVVLGRKIAEIAR